MHYILDEGISELKNSKYSIPNNSLVLLIRVSMQVTRALLCVNKWADLTLPSLKAVATPESIKIATALMTNTKTILVSYKGFKKFRTRMNLVSECF